MQFRKVPLGSNLNIDQPEDDETTKISPLELQRLKYTRRKHMTKSREDSTLGKLIVLCVAKLSVFKEKLKSKEVKEDDSNWMNHKLQCSGRHQALLYSGFCKGV